MAYELELALLAVISSAMAIFGWVMRKLIESLTNHLTEMASNQGKMVLALDIIVNKLSLWDERWIDIKRAVDTTNQPPPPPHSRRRK